MRFTAVLVFRINHMAPHTFLHPIYSGIALLCGVARFGSVRFGSFQLDFMSCCEYDFHAKCACSNLSLSVRVCVCLCCVIWFHVFVYGFSYEFKSHTDWKRLTDRIHSNFAIKLLVRRARARIPLNLIRWRITILRIHFVQFTFNHGLFSSFFVDGLLNSVANGTYTASFTACLQLFCCCYNNVGFYYTKSLRKIPLVTYLYSAHIVSQCKLCVSLFAV